MFARISLALLIFICSISLQTGAYSARNQTPSVTIQNAFPIRLPGGRLPEAGIEDAVDCNSPVHWDDEGKMHVFTSVRHPFRSSGTNLYDLSNPSSRTTIQHKEEVAGGKWLEATYRDEDGALYGWYHNEPEGVCANDPHLTAPRIGAMVSRDEGMTWTDLGLILEAPGDSLNCDTRNYYFAGGNGDFSVILDNQKNYFYFLIGTYNRNVEDQGISIARMPYASRNDPIGKVWKYRDGEWDQPGLGGDVTPIFRVNRSWHNEDIDAFWGPAIHYNTYLDMYVVLLNRAVNKYWQQEGVYISYNEDLSNPQGWSEPERLPFETLGMAYPQIIGLERGETDKRLGKYGRLFLLGQSRWLISFERDDDVDDCMNCVGPAPARVSRQRSEQPPPDRQMIRSARPSMLTDLDKPGRVERSSTGREHTIQ
jgi:hypothetical protein